MDYKQFEGHTPIDNWDEFVYELKERITWCESDPDARSWGYEEGVLISKNEAQSILARCQELEMEVAKLRAFANTIADRFNETRRSSVFVLVRDSPTWNAIEQYTAARAALKNDKV